VIMPDQDGCEICAFVKGHPRLGETPVLLISGIVTDSVRERAAQVGADDVLLKPFAADELLKRLDQLLPALVRPAEPTLPPVVETPALPTLTAEVPAVASLPPRPIEVPVVATLPPRPVEVPAVATLPPRPVEVPAAATLPPRPVEAPPVPPLVERHPLPAAGRELAAILQRFTGIEGVQWAVLADRDGFVLDSTDGAANDTAVGAALGACVAEASQGLGRELGRGTVSSVILEFEKGPVVVWRVGDAALLALGLDAPSALGKVRYYAKKALPEVAQAL